MKLLALAVLTLGGCAMNGHIVKQCPGTARLVVVKQSESSNSYLARTSEEARAMVECAKLETEESISDKLDEVHEN